MEATYRQKPDSETASTASSSLRQGAAPQAISQRAAMMDNSRPVRQLKELSDRLNHRSAPQARASQAVAQRAERTTSVYNKAQHTLYNKTMEIVDSTSADTYVHISRNAPLGEASIDTQPHANAGFFNGVNEGNKRTQIATEADDVHVNLAKYTQQNNAHITLEGRYAVAMSSLAKGLDNLVTLKDGPPVLPEFANLNFGSSVGHDNAQASPRDIFTYITDYAEDASDFANNLHEDYEGFEEEKQAVIGTINRVEAKTYAFATALIQNSPLSALPDKDFVHYAGAAWGPIRS